jgi:hypothetical protein
LVNPAIYRIARSRYYHQAFHDITAGTTPPNFRPRRSPATGRRPAGIRSPAGAAPTPRFSSRCSPGTPPHNSRASGLRHDPAACGRSSGQPLAAPAGRSLDRPARVAGRLQGGIGGCSLAGGADDAAGSCGAEQVGRLSHHQS